MAKLALSALVAATLSPLGFMYATVNDAKSLVASGYAEQSTDPTTVNPANPKEFPVRATEAGKTKQAEIDAKALAAATPSFTFISGPALEKTKRAGGRKHKYPFADFPAPTTGPDGQVITAKIFVPATEAMPNPAKSLSSTVSQASRDYATVTGSKPGKDRNQKDIMRNTYSFSRKFAIIPGEQDGVKGAYIERVL